MSPRAQAVSIAGGRAALKPARVRGESGNAEDGGARRELLEVMCEACCHEGLIDVALEVFDDIKAYDIRVSKVTLAFLEACCRRSKVPEWRVFDVCAQLRHQVTATKQARLAAQMPAKSRSHHVYGVVDSTDSSDEDDVDSSIPRPPSPRPPPRPRRPPPPPSSRTTSAASAGGAGTSRTSGSGLGGSGAGIARGRARIRAAGRMWTSRGSSSTIRTGTIRTGTTTRVTGGRAGRRRWIPCRLSFAPRGWEEVTGKTHREPEEAFFNEASKINVLARSASKKRGFRFKQSNVLKPKAVKAHFLIATRWRRKKRPARSANARRPLRSTRSPLPPRRSSSSPRVPAPRLETSPTVRSTRVPPLPFQNPDCSPGGRKRSDLDRVY